MSNITIYTTSQCPYCSRAKILLDKKGLKYEEINIENDDFLRQKMIERANRRKTVPQIFIDEQHIGGCDDLYALDKLGKLGI